MTLPLLPHGESPLIDPESLKSLEEQSKLLTEIHRLREEFEGADRELREAIVYSDQAQVKRNELREQYEAKRLALTESLDLDRWRGKAKP